MQKIDNFNFAGKKAIVRVDFNVPLDENGKITDDTRIRGALPTLKKILNDGGSLIIMSHMGKPKGKVNAKYSLGQIKDDVAKALGTDVKFVSDCVGPEAAEAAANLKPGEVLLLENLRFHPEEEGKPVGIDKEDPAYDAAKKEMKEKQKEFAKALASYADVYVNDAFGTAHRKHASTAVIADYFDANDKMLGFLMEKEVQAVDNILSDIKRPFTAIMGGSKVSTKIGTPKSALATTYPTDGKVLTQVLRHAKLSLPLSNPPRPSFGTVLPEYLNLTTSQPDHVLLPTLSLRRLKTALSPS